MSNEPTPTDQELEQVARNTADEWERNHRGRIHGDELWQVILSALRQVAKETRWSSYAGRLLDEVCDILKCPHDAEAMLSALKQVQPSLSSASQKHQSTGPSQPEETGIALIAAERQRQVSEEGWTPQHDDTHKKGELAMLAAYYAMTQSRRNAFAMSPPFDWPFGSEWIKSTPHNRLRELVKAGALIAAEIDRVLRAGREKARIFREMAPRGIACSAKDQKPLVDSIAVSPQEQQECECLEMAGNCPVHSPLGERRKEGDGACSTAPDTSTSNAAPTSNPKGAASCVPNIDTQDARNLMLEIRGTLQAVTTADKIDSRIKHWAGVSIKRLEQLYAYIEPTDVPSPKNL